MMNYLKKTCLMLTLLLIQLLGLASSKANNTTTIQAPAGTYTYYCPNPADLIKNPIKLTWSSRPPAPNKQPNFQGFDKSFAKKIKVFLGAQWNGVNLGENHLSLPR